MLAFAQIEHEYNFTELLACLLVSLQFTISRRHTEHQDTVLTHSVELSRNKYNQHYIFPKLRKTIFSSSHNMDLLNLSFECKHSGMIWLLMWPWKWVAQYWNFLCGLLTTGTLTLCLRAWFLLLKNKISFFLMTWFLKKNNCSVNEDITSFISKIIVVSDIKENHKYTEMYIGIYYCSRQHLLSA